MIAGDPYTFQIQSRDFYSNNMKLLLNDALDDKGYLVEYTHPETSELGVIVDDTDLGVFEVQITLYITGFYDLRIQLKGLDVPTQLPQKVEVIPAILTSPATSHYSGALPSYLTGETITLLITARDIYNNLRLSTDDQFYLTVTS
jgi:hypothetical protein